MLTPPCPYVFLYIFLSMPIYDITPSKQTSKTIRLFSNISPPLYIKYSFCENSGMGLVNADLWFKRKIIWHNLEVSKYIFPTTNSEIISLRQTNFCRYVRPLQFVKKSAEGLDSTSPNVTYYKGGAWVQILMCRRGPPKRYTDITPQQ